LDQVDTLLFEIFRRNPGSDERGAAIFFWSVRCPTSSGTLGLCSIIEADYKEVTVKVSLPDDLKGFVEKQLSSGRYANPDAFVAELLHDEAAMFERISRGEPLPINEHFDRRLEALLDEAEASGDYVGATKKDFDAMEREALELVRKRKSS